MGSARRMPAWTSRESLRAASVEGLVFGPQDVGQGRGKALLGPVDDFGRQVTPRQAALDDAQRPALHLETTRQAGCELGQAMVHERAARLEAMGHRHAVGDHHRVVRQAHARIRIQHVVERLAVDVPVRTCDGGFGRRRAELSAGLGCQQILACLAVEVEIGEARRIAVGALEERELVQPPHLVALALVPARLRDQREERLHHAPANGRRNRGVAPRVQVSVVAVVAAEQLVAAVAADHDLDVLARELRDLVGAEGQRIGRLVEVVDELRQVFQERRIQRALVVLGAGGAGHRACMRRLVELRVGQPDRECRQVLHADALREHRDQQARVEAAAQEGADGHVAHQVQPQRFVDLFFELVGERLVAALELRLVGEVPVAANRGFAAVLEHQHVPGREFADAAVHRARRRDEAQGQVLVERLEIHLAQRRVAGEQRLDLRREGEAGRGARVVERLLAEVVARDDQLAAARIPEAEREHAAQVLDQALAVAFVERDDQLAVAVGLERVAALLEVLAQLPVVVDLAVADHPDRAVGVQERLPAAFEVDDGQAPVPEDRAVGAVLPFAVRAAMAQRMQHARHGRLLGAVALDDARDAAHARSALAARAARIDRALHDRLVALGAAVDEELLDARAVELAELAASLRATR